MNKKFISGLGVFRNRIVEKCWAKQIGLATME
jgi:hypothetical protein